MRWRVSSTKLLSSFCVSFLEFEAFHGSFLMCVHTYQDIDEQFDSLKTSTHTLLHIYTETLSHSIMSSHIVFLRLKMLICHDLQIIEYNGSEMRIGTSPTPSTAKWLTMLKCYSYTMWWFTSLKSPWKKYPGEVIICIGGNDLHSRLSCFLIISQFLKTCVCWWTLVMSCTLLLIMFASARI